jgi:CDP-diacylglycerol--glycerol-3-phosphate 3-phosphatidyltransferase
MPSRIVHNVPVALTALRLALGPVVILLALYRPNTAAFAACLVFALLSDYFDGVIARHLNIATPSLRRLDSLADSIFYVSALVAAWLLHAVILLPYLTSLAVLIAAELVRYIYDFWKFGKEASYHMWSSKLWGLMLFLALFAVLVLGRAGWPVSAAIYLGIVADLEGIAISATLSKWTNDVPTLFHARKLSRTDG